MRSGLAYGSLILSADLRDTGLSTAKPFKKSKKEYKRKRCRVCLEPFQPFQSLQATCSIECALMLSKKNLAKKSRREDRLKLIKLRTRSQWIKLTQYDFNAFIRERDQGKACISCGKPIHLKRNAGHYLSTGSHPELRFNELNCHLQCERCNSYLSGNASAYRLGLLERIGLESVEYLEGPHEPKKYTIDELERLRAEYRSKLKSLKAQRERVGADLHAL